MLGVSVGAAMCRKGQKKKAMAAKMMSLPTDSAPSESGSIWRHF